jgi:hypothetical protein
MPDFQRLRVTAASLCLSVTISTIGIPNDTQAQQGNCTAPNMQNDARQSSSQDDVNRKLADCGGVLKPPAIGDSMVEPAPKEGTTPVIPPRDIPAPGKEKPQSK